MKTGAFPEYPLKGKVDDVRRNTGNVNELPDLSILLVEKYFLIEIKYLRYHPKLVFQLSIYESIFCSIDNGRGVNENIY